MLSGWKGKQWMYWPFSQILSINGYHCITYTYDPIILSADIYLSAHLIKHIAHHICLQINQLKKQGINEFSVFGTSLGSVISLVAANQSADISKIILNTTGSDISEAVWSWDHVVPDFKLSLLAKGITLTQLKQAWKDINPQHNLAHLHNKKLLIYLSSKDELIPWQLGQNLVSRLDHLGYHYQLITNHSLSHSHTGLINLLNVRSYLNFLAEPKV